MNYCLMAFFLNAYLLAQSAKIEISGESRIVSGATAHFSSHLTNDERSRTSYTLQWELNFITMRRIAIRDVSGPYGYWNVSFNRADTPPGIYEIKVTLLDIHSPVISATFPLEITEMLNGALLLFQEDEIKNLFVSNKTMVTHQIELNETDAEFLKNATNYLVYWFVDCIDYGPVQDFTFDYHYTEVRNYTAEALIIANLNNNGTEKLKPNLEPVTDIPYVCGANDVNRVVGNVYGHFKTTVDTRIPIFDLNIHTLENIEDVQSTNATVTCEGTGPFSFCYSLLHERISTPNKGLCHCKWDPQDKCFFVVPIHKIIDDDYVIFYFTIKNDVSEISLGTLINVEKTEWNSTVRIC